MLKKILVLFVLGFLLMPVFATHGQTCDSSGTNPSLPPCSSIGYVRDSADVGSYFYGSQQTRQTTSIGVFVSSIMRLVNWLSWFIGVAAVVMGLYSGFLFITARDNANQITTARNTMMYAIIGIGVAILAFSLVTLSTSILGL